MLHYSIESRVPTGATYKVKKSLSFKNSNQKHEMKEKSLTGECAGKGPPKKLICGWVTITSIFTV